MAAIASAPKSERRTFCVQQRLEQALAETELQRSREAGEATHADEGRVAGSPPDGRRDCRHAGEDVRDSTQLAPSRVPLLLYRQRGRSGSGKVPVRGGVGVNVVAACWSTGQA